MSVNKERVGKLLEALRSGKYKMAKGGLQRFNNSYCALGVACDLYKDSTNYGYWEDGEFCTKFERHGGSLPDLVRLWYGFSDKLETDIWTWNDKICDSLSCVADKIEEAIGGTT